MLTSKIPQRLVLFAAVLAMVAFSAIALDDTPLSSDSTLDQLRSDPSPATQAATSPDRGESAFNRVTDTVLRPLTRSSTVPSPGPEAESTTAGNTPIESNCGGGLEVIIQSGGDQLGGVVEVYACSETLWPWPVDRAGEIPTTWQHGETVDIRQGVAIAEIRRFKGTEGRCHVPWDGQPLRSLAVVVPGFDLQTFDRVAIAPTSSAPKRLVVELESGHCAAVAGRVVDETGHAARSARAVWSASQPPVPWRAALPTGPFPRMGGDQFRGSIEVPADVQSDGNFELSPVLPSTTGVVRVFLGDILVATRSGLCTVAGRRLDIEPIMVPVCRILTIRLTVAGQFVGGFRVLVRGGVTTPEMNHAFSGASHANADPRGEVRAPVRNDAPVTIQVLLNTLDGRYSVLQQANDMFSDVLTAAQALVNQVLETRAVHLDHRESLADDVTINVTATQLREALVAPANASALDTLRLAIATSTEAPRELLAAARAAAHRKDLLPLFRQFLEPLN